MADSNGLVCPRLRNVDETNMKTSTSVLRWSGASVNHD